MCATMYVCSIRFISLLAFAVTTPVLIASCTHPENAETSGILKFTCHSDEEVMKVSWEDDLDLGLVQLSEVPWVGVDLVIPLIEPAALTVLSLADACISSDDFVDTQASFKPNNKNIHVTMAFIKLLYLTKQLLKLC